MRDTSDPTYRAWHNMLKRCGDPTNADYGGRGITVCARWRSFDAFLADMGAKPDGLTLERKDNAGNYEPGNCEWASRRVQTRNKRNNRWVVVDGERLCLADALVRRGMNESTFYYRVTEGGMSDQEAIDTPVRTYGSN